MSPHNLTIVIKLGTTLLTAGSNQLNQIKMLNIVRECAELLDRQYRVIIVTSGAIAAGREYLNYPELPETIASKQLLAAVGQTQLILTWQKLFGIYGIHIGQMLLTRADLEDKERFLNAKDTLGALLKQRIIPVINENDAVVTSEIKVGDNDNLSALVAILAEADKLLILSDINGLYTSDPNKDPTATLLSEVRYIDKNIRKMAGGSQSSLGTGGMATKIQSAAIATQAGVEVIIASGSMPHVIRDVANNLNIGTRFLAQDPPLGSKKYWIFGAPTAGLVHIDIGAKQALINNASLLPKGILSIEGNFSRGEVILITDELGNAIAKGVARYNSDALNLIKGKYSKNILFLLGYHYGDVVVHHDEMILTD